MHLLLQFYVNSDLKLYRCLGDGLKMCILFGNNPRNFFCHFFTKLTLLFFSAKVN